MFLDEPTAALDPEAAFIVREAIETLRRAGRTIVLATHNLDEADRLCDRVAFVRGGLLRIDSPARLRGALGTRGLAIRFAAAPPTAAIDAMRTVPGVTTVEATGAPCGWPPPIPSRSRPPWSVRWSPPARTSWRSAPSGRRSSRSTSMSWASAREPRRGDLMRAPSSGRSCGASGSRSSATACSLSTILLPPVFLTIAPIMLAGLVGERELPPELAAQILAQKPEWAAFTAGELAGAFAVQQFLVFFLLMPAYIPLSIATFSIIGEKQARSLEPVLAAPIRTVELLAGKAVAALVPGVLAGWATYVVFVALASIVYGPALFGVVTDASWLAGVFLLGPAVGLSSVVAGVIVSARVNDPRVAQQIGGVIIVPIVVLVLVQATGTLLVGAAGYTILALIVLVVSLVGPADRRPPVRSRGDPDPLALGHARAPGPIIRSGSGPQT